MSANGLRVQSVYSNDTVNSPALSPSQISQSYYNHVVQGSWMTTISSANVDRDTTLSGLLHVPSTDQPAADCPSNLTSYIPQAVADASAAINISDVQPSVFLAPWLGPTCIFSFLIEAQRRSAVAFLTYQADDYTTGSPPTSSASAWPIDTGSISYEPPFPIYAIPGGDGHGIMDALAILVNQTNNASTTANGSTSTQGSSTQPVWLLAQVGVEATSNGLPGLWVIILSVVAVFLGALIFISLVTRIVQRRRRNDLRRRILDGRVELSMLGVRRITVPEDILSTFPIEKYAEHDSSSTGSPNRTSTTSIQKGSSMSHRYSQPSCPICIEDYDDDSTVRVLPCGHIFHPECVDTFLRENSSLCPMCKRTVLPAGYCPAVVTNAMVRRERAARMRADQPFGVIVNSDGSAPGQHRRPASATSNTSQQQGPRRGVGRIWHALGGRAPAPPSSPPDQAVEMQPTTTTTGQPSEPEPPSSIRATEQAPPPDRRRRREWARWRAVQMVETSSAGAAAETSPEVEEDRRPRWRKALARVFPVL